ncbi:hypothetical protein [uncultured Dysosmobacter sp.]|uniref:hypothetical protein n=1 Tax=uncultured Dysosmobacter sp. TaxID=2591384 RepID=UPI00260A0538|nr:hypothetical protein [uncultured Dysosmobacter sp.]
MKPTAYKDELNEVRYTDAGRTALVEALMEARTAEQPRQRRRWGRRGLVAVLAAALLVTAAAAAATPLWMRFFGGLDEQQQAVVDAMQTGKDSLPAAAEAEGVTITPLSILGSGNRLYITLEIRAPEGTTFSAERGRYVLLASTKPKEVTEMASYTSRFTVLEAGTEAPNVLTGVYEVTSSCDLGGGTLTIMGLSLWKERGQDEWIFEGEWTIPLPEDLTGNHTLEPQAEGVTVETEQGTFTLDAISVSPLGLWWQYRFDGTNEPVIYAALKMKDGSLVEPAPGQMILGHPGGNETATVSFAKPVDLSQAAALYWGNAEIPLDGRGEPKADENIPAISDEPPFVDLPAAQLEKDAGPGADSDPAPAPEQPETGGKTEFRFTDTGMTFTAESGGGELTDLQQRRDDYYLKTLSLSDCEMIHNEPVTDQFVYQNVYGERCFGIDYLTFAEDGYARVSYWSHDDETCVLAVYRDENGGTWGRAFRVPEELLYTGN